MKEIGIVVVGDVGHGSTMAVQEVFMKAGHHAIIVDEFNESVTQKERDEIKISARGYGKSYAFTAQEVFHITPIVRNTDRFEKQYHKKQYKHKLKKR